MLKVHGYGFTLTKGRSKQRKKMCSFKEILIVLLLALISAVAKAQELGKKYGGVEFESRWLIFCT